jgi:sulfane dehydrogenase subunit SoxC
MIKHRRTGMKPLLDPSGFFGRIPLLPHQMTERMTSTENVIVLCHLGVPKIDPGQWRLDIDGLVEQPLSLAFDDLARLPFAQIESVHQCAGSPLRPSVPTRRVSNVVWGGVRLADVLELAGVKPEAAYVWSTGCDHGAFDGVPCDAYVKDMPLTRLNQDVLLATELNGAPLPPEHGFPVRLVVPGYYGTNSVKWLTRLTLSGSRAIGPFTTRWYNDPVGDTGTTRPVWAIAPEAVIVEPAPDQVVPHGSVTLVGGWAWADDGIARVGISDDAGATWQQATLDPPTGRGWHAFSIAWTPPRIGPATLMVRATSRDGAEQPMDGHRNAVHRVGVMVA